VGWVDLALAYTVVGDDKKAGRAIRAALQLAPNDRFVLRSAARFFIHIGEPQIAFEHLARADSTKVDPWLMAAEIAVADYLGRTSRLQKVARGEIESGKSGHDLTELASALGSLEAANGNRRAARRLLKKALNGANENTVAQIRWLNRTSLGEVVDASAAAPPLLYEANAWVSYHAGDFQAALGESLRWLRYQPFSSAPATLSSFILADLMWDFQAGASVAEAGLKANPRDLMLLNNFAVC